MQIENKLLFYYLYKIYQYIIPQLIIML